MPTPRRRPTGRPQGQADPTAMMTVLMFSYQALMEPKGSPKVTSLIAYLAPAQGPLQAVMWHAGRKEWIYAPAIAAGPVFDEAYSDEMVRVDRATAEAMASELLPSSVPTVETLREMISEGVRMGWDYGPPLSSGR